MVAPTPPDIDVLPKLGSSLPHDTVALSKFAHGPCADPSGSGGAHARRLLLDAGNERSKVSSSAGCPGVIPRWCAYWNDRRANALSCISAGDVM